MRLAVIGGTRFIGRAAVACALARGHDVTLLHRGVHPAPPGCGARELLVDRGDADALRRALDLAAPQVVVDTRAMTRADAMASVEAIAAQHAFTVVLSSQDVYAQFGTLNGLPGPAPEEEVTESSPLTVPFPFRGVAGRDGLDDYDKKLVERVFAEALVGEASLRESGVTVLRLPAVYGRHDPQRRFGSIVDALDDGEPLPATGMASLRLTHAHVDDVAHAILLAAEARRPGWSVYNVGEAATPTMHERVEAIAAAAGRPLVWRQVADVPPAHALLGRLPNDMVASSARIRADLGFSEITTAQMRMLDLVAWTRETRGDVRRTRTAT